MWRPTLTLGLAWWFISIVRMVVPPLRDGWCWAVQKSAKEATTLLTDNFTTDTTLDTTSTWILASDGGATLGTFLLAHSIQWYLEWPITFNGFNVQTNSNLTAGGAWNTNAITAIPMATVYHANVDATNLPPSGNLFFRAVH